ncbi:MAG: tetratricopeptide repeat protein [Rhodospirillales bacterium]
MADHTEDSLIREIDDELRQEQFQKVWNRYSKLILAAAGLCVAAVAGYQFWIKHDLETRQALGERFDNAQKQAETGSIDAAVTTFRTLADEGGGYGLLARFQAAGLLAKEGDQAGAVAAYDAIAADKSIDKLYQDLAVILAAGIEVNDPGADLQKLQDRLAPLSKAGSPWRFTAQELTAAAALRAGDKAKAREIYGELAKDNATPARMRQRATELLTILR